MESLGPYCFSSKKLSWLNFCAAFANWKLISALKNNKIFCQVMLSFLNLVSIMRIANWTRINQSLSFVISHDPYCYCWSKISWFYRQQNQFQLWEMTNQPFICLRIFLNFPSVWPKLLKFESFSFSFFEILKVLLKYVK